MVGRLSLPEVAGEALLEGKRGLDSPDSGLPPSPSPPTPGLANGLPERDSPATFKPSPPPPPPPPLQPLQDALPLAASPLPGCTSRLCPLSFGEGVEFDPLPPKDIRYTSSVKYDSEKHFINNIYMPMGLGVSACSQTVFCVPQSTWRNYKAEVHFQPRNKAASFTSTAIFYPFHTTTVLPPFYNYNCRKHMRKFLSSVELESSGNEDGPESC
uniref:Refilin B n=1 Tax=Anolis carolinensis TaxID=28377 RepID=H9GV76_ANOCA|nr:PREDICTED: filamin-interacting protein FAM101B [Anolis carolinensis]|eukprot:XP_003227934.1 PREDICTED: filamin-interacting protein FAM101B [Anolis carolinensis]